MAAVRRREENELSYLRLGIRFLRADASKFILAGVTFVVAVALMIVTIGTMRLGFAVLEAQKSASRALGDVTILPSVSGQQLMDEETRLCSSLPHVAECIPISSFSVSLRRSGQPAKASNVTGVPETLKLSAYGFSSVVAIPTVASKGALLPKQLADDLSAVIGDTLEVSSPTGGKEVTVAGILDEKDSALTLGDSIFVSLDWVTASSGADKASFTRIDVKLDGSVSVEEWMSTYGSLLPKNTQLFDAKEGVQALEPLFMAVQLVLVVATMGLAALALWLMAIAFQRALLEQKEAYETMSYLGASARWLARVIASQVVVFGVLGVGLGVLAAAFAQPVVLAAFSQVTGASRMSMALNLLDASTGALLGFALGGSAAYRPVRAINAHFNEQRRGAKRIWTRMSAARHAVIIIATLAFAALGAFSVVSPRSMINSLCALLTIPLVLVFVPYIIRVISGAVRVKAVVSELAMMNLKTRPTMRVSATLLALLAALSSMILIVVSGVSSLMMAQVKAQFGADLQISAKTPRIDGSVDRVLTGISGVGTVSPMSIVDVTLRSLDQNVTVSARVIDPDTYFKTASFAIENSSDLNVSDLLSDEGTGCKLLVPTGLAARYGLAEKAEINLIYGDTDLRCEVVGRFAALATGNQIVLPSYVGRQLGVEGINAWNLSLSDEAGKIQTEDLVKEAVSSQPDIEVTSAQAMLEKASREAAQYTNAPLFSVMVMAVMTAGATMSLLSLELESRKPDYRTWLYLGVAPRVAQRSFLVEFLASVGVGVLAGCLAGIIGGQALTHAVGGLLGIDLPLSLPIGEIGIGIAGVAGVSLITLIPALFRMNRTEEGVVE